MNSDYLFFLQQLCRDWSKKSNTNTVQPQDTATSKTALVSDGNGKTSPQQPTSAAIKKVQNQDSKSEGSNRSSTSSWYEYLKNHAVTYYRLNQLAQLIFRVLSSHFQGRRAYFNKHGYLDRPYGLSLHGRPPEKQATFGTRMGRSLWLWSRAVCYNNSI